MMKKRTVIGVSAAAAILAAIAMGTFRTQNVKPNKTATPAITKQAQPTLEEQPDDPVSETVTLTEPKQSEITPAEPLIESEQPIQETESKPTSTLDEPQEHPKTSIAPQEIPKEKPKQPTSAQPKAPKNGDTKDGQIYIEGFGWVEDHGGGGSGTVDSEMYQNGNKIGTFG